MEPWSSEEAFQEFVLTGSKTIAESLPRPDSPRAYSKVQMDWAAKLYSHGLSGRNVWAVAIVLWFISSLNNGSRSVQPSRKHWTKLGLDRRDVSRGLKPLELVGLVSIERKPGKSSRITILDVNTPQVASEESEATAPAEVNPEWRAVDPVAVVQKVAPAFQKQLGKELGECKPLLAPRVRKLVRANGPLTVQYAILLWGHNAKALGFLVKCRSPLAAFLKQMDTVGGQEHLEQWLAKGRKTAAWWADAAARAVQFGETGRAIGQISATEEKSMVRSPGHSAGPGGQN